jgi:hypothetical protein
LLAGMLQALLNLQGAGCKVVYVDGSFVTDKEVPPDYDACWDTRGVNPVLLDPVLLRFENRRAAQKAKYHGEFFPAEWVADGLGQTYLEFFQVDKETGDSKGIVALDLGGAQL